MAKEIKRVQSKGDAYDTNYHTVYTNSTSGPAMIIQVHISNDDNNDSVSAGIRIADSAGSNPLCLIANDVLVPSNDAIVDNTKYIINAGETLQFATGDTSQNVWLNAVIVEGIND